jgi:hypothetical protein
MGSIVGETLDDVSGEGRSLEEVRIRVDTPAPELFKLFAPANHQLIEIFERRLLGRGWLLLRIHSLTVYRIKSFIE